MMRIVAVIGTVFVLGGLALATPLSPAQRAEFETRIEANKLETQSKIAVLEAGLDALGADDQTDLQRQITELKRQSEIARLNILLDWATMEEDQERIAEVEGALQNWLNPPQSVTPPSLYSAPGPQSGTSEQIRR